MTTLLKPIWRAFLWLAGERDRDDMVGPLYRSECALLARMSDTEFQPGIELLNGPDDHIALLHWSLDRLWRFGYVEKDVRVVALPARAMTNWNGKRTTYRRTGLGKAFIDSIDAAAEEGAGG